MNLWKLEQIIKNRKDMKEKEIRINVPEGYEIDKEKSTFEHIVFKKKENKLPKTWEEFCDTNKSAENTYFVGSWSEIVRIETDIYNYRDPSTDKNLLPSKELAEAMLALCQLIQLRECYNDGWKPDWKSNDCKYCISTQEGEIAAECSLNKNIILTFKTKELRDEFYNNFKDLIEVAKQLL